MGFVKTAEEMADLQARWNPPHFLSDQIAVEFTTTQEFVRYILPPCCEPADTPTGFVMVARYQSSGCGDMECAWIGVNARFREFDGVWTIGLYIDNDFPVAIGREPSAEIKKRGEFGYFQDGPHIYAWASRLGTRLIEVEATFGEDEGPGEASFTQLEFKGIPTPELDAFEWDPKMLLIECTDSYDSVRRGTAEVVLRGSVHDPLDTIPIKSWGEATHTIGETISRTPHRIPLEIEDHSEYLPYHMGRAFDNSEYLHRPLRYRTAELSA